MNLIQILFLLVKMTQILFLLAKTGADIILTYEVLDEETSEDENHTSTIWTEWDGIEDSITTTKDDWNSWNY